MRLITGPVFSSCSNIFFFGNKNNQNSLAPRGAKINIVSHYKFAVVVVSRRHHAKNTSRGAIKFRIATNLQFFSDRGMPREVLWGLQSFRCGILFSHLVLGWCRRGFRVVGRRGVNIWKGTKKVILSIKRLNKKLHFKNNVLKNKI